MFNGWHHMEDGVARPAEPVVPFSAAILSLARAAGDPAPSDWQDKVKNEGAYYEIVIDMGAGKTVKWGTYCDDKGIYYKATEGTSDLEALLSLRKFADPSTKIVEAVKPDVPNPPAEKDEKIYAEIDPTTLTIYKYGKAAPTNTEIVNAVLAAAPNDGLTADDIVVKSSTSVEVDGTLRTMSVVKLYKVTLPDGTVKYVKDGGEITGITGADYLMDVDSASSDKLTTTAGGGNYNNGTYAVSEGKIKFFADTTSDTGKSDASNIDKATYWDYTLVKAVKVAGVELASGASKTYDVYVENPEESDGTKDGWTVLTDVVVANGKTKKDHYVPASKKLLVEDTQSGTTMVGTQVNAKINDKQFVSGKYVNSGENAVASIIINSVTAWDKDAPSVVTIALVSGGAKVMWDGKEIVNPDSPDGTWATGAIVDLGAPADGSVKWIAGNSAALTDAVKFVPGTTQKFELLAKYAEVDGVISFNKAHSVAWNNGGNPWGLTKTEDDTNTLTGFVYSGCLVKDGYTLLLRAGTENATLKPTKDSKWTAGELGNPVFNDDDQAEYTIKVTKDIAVTDFENAVAVAAGTPDKLDLIAKDQTTGEIAAETAVETAIEFAVTGAKGLTKDSKVDVRMVENSTTTNLKKLVLEVEKTYKNGNTDGKIAVTLKNPSATEEVTITKDDVVTLRVTVDGITVDTEISIVAKS